MERGELAETAAILFWERCPTSFVCLGTEAKAPYSQHHWGDRILVKVFWSIIKASIDKLQQVYNNLLQSASSRNFHFLVLFFFNPSALKGLKVRGSWQDDFDEIPVTLNIILAAFFDDIYFLL